MCVEADHVGSDICGNAEACPAERQDLFGHSVKGPLDVPARKKVACFTFFSFFHLIPEL
jgi:hypothetical protein